MDEGPNFHFRFARNLPQSLDLPSLLVKSSVSISDSTAYSRPRSKGNVSDWSFTGLSLMPMLPSHSNLVTRAKATRMPRAGSYLAGLLRFTWPRRSNFARSYQISLTLYNSGHMPGRSSMHSYGVHIWSLRRSFSSVWGRNCLNLNQQRCRKYNSIFWNHTLHHVTKR